MITVTFDLSKASADELVTEKIVIDKEVNDTPELPFGEK
jgi:hypothetical protein